MMPGIRRLLGGIGAIVRARLSFTLQLAALIWGVVREAAFAGTWRRTVRGMFRRTLTSVVGGSLGTIVVTGIVIGLGLVFEALYWLRTAGQESQVGHVIVLLLIRVITPLLIGIILLGRAGLATVAELGMLQTEGEVGVMRAEGLDIFQLLVLPRAVAFALGAFSLGVMFVLVALLSGYLTGSFAGVVNVSIFLFLDDVLRSMSVQDLIVFPLKLALIGLVVAGVCCLTGLAAQPQEGSSMVLPRGFTRGITSVLAVTVGTGVLL
jgi:phospholipid/cholesterol/gamma-HCH transport system permease protein